MMEAYSFQRVVLQDGFIPRYRAGFTANLSAPIIEVQIWVNTLGLKGINSIKLKNEYIRLE